MDVARRYGFFAVLRIALAEELRKLLLGGKNSFDKSFYFEFTKVLKVNFLERV